MLTRARRRAAAHGQCQHAVSQHILSLPQPLIEMILLPSTGLEDKKALRETCMLFQQVLDDSLLSINLNFPTEADYHCLEKWQKRVENMYRLRVVFLRGYNRTSRSTSMLGLVKELPIGITTLVIHSDAVKNKFDLKKLRRLPCSTALCLRWVDQITGMKHISGLTRLEVDKPVGSVAHLAPTLKHLRIFDFGDIQDMGLLTNLETLQVFMGTPSNFFQVNGHLPLKHLHLCNTSSHPLCTAQKAWNFAPKTLTSLYVNQLCEGLGVLPASITHLLIDDASGEDVKRATWCLPGITHLGLCVVEHYSDHLHGCFETLSSFTNLQSLCLLIQNSYWSMPWQRNRVLEHVPEVASAVKKGMELDVCESWDEFMGVFCNSFDIKPTWIVPA